MIKVSTFLSENEYGYSAVPLFGPADAEFEKRASAYLLPPVLRYIENLRPRNDSQYVLVNALAASEYFGSNINGDAFPEASLLHCPDRWTGNPLVDRALSKDWPYGFPTFYNAHAFAHHRNKDPSKAYGDVELAMWNDHMKRVELVVRVDHDKCVMHGGVQVWDKLKNGQFPDVSMGSKVPYDTSSITLDWKLYREAQATFDPKRHKHPGMAVLEFHKRLKARGKQGIPGLSITRNDYDEWCQKKMNFILPDGRKVFVYNDYPRFFDISFVFIGADRTAKTMVYIVRHGMARYAPSAKAGEKVAAASTHAWVTGPSGAGKTTYVRENYPRRSVVHLDDYSGGEKGLDWEGVKAALQAARRPAVVEGVPVHTQLAEGVKNKVLLYPGREEQARRFMQRAERDNPKGMGDPERRYVQGLGEDLHDYYDKEILPHAQELGFKTAAAQSQKCLSNVLDLVSKKPGLTIMTGPPDKKYDTRHFWAVDAEGKVHDPTRSDYAHYAKGTPFDVKANADFISGMQTVKKAATEDYILKAAFGIKDAELKRAEIDKEVVPSQMAGKAIPVLTKNEKDLPELLLKMLASRPEDEALSTSGALGIVLRPREYQRITLIRMGEGPLAKGLEDAGVTFPKVKEVDKSTALSPDKFSPLLASLLEPLLSARSMLGPAIERRVVMMAVSPKGDKKTPSSHSSKLLRKIGAAYNGYRAQLMEYVANSKDCMQKAASFSDDFCKLASATPEEMFTPLSYCYLRDAFLDELGVPMDSKGVVER